VTPAIQTLKKAGIAHRVHEYAHDPAVESFGEEAAQALGIDETVIFKTLLAATGPKDFVVGIVPVCCQLDLKALAAAIGAKRAEMAPPAAAERLTGYVVGGISPIGQRRKLPTVIDASAMEHDEVYVSGGRRGLDVSLRPADLVSVLAAAVAPIAKWK
jgi:Cys-tRNA(Pro)/Cys-tRNA(Cys) deacylase